MRLDLFEAQRHEREHGVVDFLVVGRKRMFRAGGFPRARRADFVAQFNDDALGGFFADAGNLRKRFHVAACHRAAKCRHVHAAQNIQRRFRADAADAVDEQSEQIALRRRHETVKRVRILADDELSEQFHRLAGLRQFVERRQRNQHLVADTVHVHDDLRGQCFDEFAVEKSDHQIFFERRQDCNANFPARGSAPAPARPRRRARAASADSTAAAPFLRRRIFAPRRSRRWPASLCAWRFHKFPVPLRQWPPAPRRAPRP